MWRLQGHWHLRTLGLLPQTGAPKHLCVILHTGKVGPEKMRELCETTSYTEAVRARKKYRLLDLLVLLMRTLKVREVIYLRSYS